MIKMRKSFSQKTHIQKTLNIKRTSVEKVNNEKKASSIVTFDVISSKRSNARNDSREETFTFKSSQSKIDRHENTSKINTSKKTTFVSFDKREIDFLDVVNDEKILNNTFIDLRQRSRINFSTIITFDSNKHSQQSQSMSKTASLFQASIESRKSLKDAHLFDDFAKIEIQTVKKLNI